MKSGDRGGQRLCPTVHFQRFISVKHLLYLQCGMSPHRVESSNPFQFLLTQKRTESECSDTVRRCLRVKQRSQNFRLPDTVHHGLIFSDCSWLQCTACGFSAPYSRMFWLSEVEPRCLREKGLSNTWTLQALIGETNGNIEFLQPYHFLAANTLLQVL
jgi:hypothetical protein